MNNLLQCHHNQSASATITTAFPWPLSVARFRMLTSATRTKGLLTLLCTLKSTRSVGQLHWVMVRSGTQGNWQTIVFHNSEAFLWRKITGTHFMSHNFQLEKRAGYPLCASGIKEGDIRCIWSNNILYPNLTYHTYHIWPNCNHI